MSKRGIRFKVVLLEINEVAWTLIDRFIAKGVLPNFARLKEEGAWTTCLDEDGHEFLNPWSGDPARPL